MAWAFFERWIYTFGVPTVIVSDRDKKFLNEVMQDLTRWLGANNDKTSHYMDWPFFFFSAVPQRLDAGD